MAAELTTIKITKAAREDLRKIAGISGKKLYEVIAELLKQEKERLGIPTLKNKRPT